jgi:hypothetical protein
MSSALPRSFDDRQFSRFLPEREIQELYSALSQR